ncbi:MIT domain-containing protein 1 [Aplysia californica]|uniref:MIT domain-containing protein 1 n=1 Tax=Aplysia californica TaxID=6500 RepID=A0ABM0JN41_APLCA|nr:MIT domain-containing protein 1 [Aplysia californica]XP_005097568.1 MIT domain-containing protein 1 [Aplysia californica]
MADDKTAGVEASAISILKRAVELDNTKRFDESLTCYQEGVGLLMQVLKSVNDAGKRQRYRLKIEEYLARAEELKVFVKEEKEASKQHEQIHIEPDTTGHSYDSLFGRYLNQHVTAVEVEDPYIRSHHQVQNFLRLCELIVSRKSPVKTITLTTGRDDEMSRQQQQHQWLLAVGKSLQSRGIRLQIIYSDTLHDREIRLDTGWVIKIGRGLDIYKNCDKFSIGFCDMELRPCHETTVDIFHRKSMKSTCPS